MCEPTSIALVTMAVISAATAAYSANKQKHATETQLKVKQQQQDAATQAQTLDRMKAAREQRAAARAASAESGVSGNSAQAVLNDIQMQAGMDVSRIQKNGINADTASALQAKSAYSEINGSLAQSLASSLSTAGSAYASRSSSAPDSVLNTPVPYDNSAPKVTF